MSQSDQSAFTGAPAPPPEDITRLNLVTPGGEDTYKTVTEGVRPYIAHIGDQSFRFTRKPNAKLQLELAKIADQQMGTKQVSFIRDVVAAMLEQPEQVEEILTLIDAEEVARLINNATKAMSTRPTTEQQGS